MFGEFSEFLRSVSITTHVTELSPWSIQSQKSAFLIIFESFLWSFNRRTKPDEIFVLLFQLLSVTINKSSKHRWDKLILFMRFFGTPRTSSNFIWMPYSVVVWYCYDISDGKIISNAVMRRCLFNRKSNIRSVRGKTGILQARLGKWRGQGRGRRYRKGLQKIGVFCEIFPFEYSISFWDAKT